MDYVPFPGGCALAPLPSYGQTKSGIDSCIADNNLTLAGLALALSMVIHTWWARRLMRKFRLYLNEHSDSWVDYPWAASDVFKGREDFTGETRV